MNFLSTVLPSARHQEGRRRGLLRGAAAGAAGTTALNAVTYLDMALRGRPSSDAPEDTVVKISNKADISIPGDTKTRQNRLEGLGPLSGIATGVGVGALFGMSRTARWRPGFVASALVGAFGVLLGSNGPMTALRVTDPRTWSTVDWISDVVPHLAYGAVTAAVLIGLEG